MNKYDCHASRRITYNIASPQNLKINFAMPACQERCPITLVQLVAKATTDAAQASDQNRTDPLRSPIIISRPQHQRRHRKHKISNPSRKRCHQLPRHHEVWKGIKAFLREQHVIQVENCPRSSGGAPQEPRRSSVGAPQEPRRSSAGAPQELRRSSENSTKVTHRFIGIGA